MPPSTEGLGHTLITALDEETYLVKSQHYSYPGGDATFSSTVFLSLYEEEETRERQECPEDRETVDINAEFSPLDNRLERARRPTIYFVLRMLDSIKGFHKVREICSSLAWFSLSQLTVVLQGYLDLSGRHPEVDF